MCRIEATAREYHTHKKPHSSKDFRVSVVIMGQSGITTGIYEATLGELLMVAFPFRDILNEQLDKRNIKIYETILRELLMVASPFQDILNGQLDRKNKFWQTLYIVLITVYVIPRECFIGCLYLVSADTREFYQYWIGDYLEVLEIIGRIVNMLLGVWNCHCYG